MKLDRTLYLNTDKSAVVEEGGDDAAYLLGRKGQEISDEDARKYGLMEGEEGSGEVAADAPAPTSQEQNEEADRITKEAAESQKETNEAIAATAQDEETGEEAEPVPSADPESIGKKSDE